MKTYDTIEAIGTKLDELIERIESGGLEAEEVREITMVLRILDQRASLIKDHALEAKVDAIMKQWEARQQVRRIA